MQIPSRTVPSLNKCLIELFSRIVLLLEEQELPESCLLLGRGFHILNRVFVIVTEQGWRQEVTKYCCRHLIKFSKLYLPTDRQLPWAGSICPAPLQPFRPLAERMMGSQKGWLRYPGPFLPASQGQRASVLVFESFLK